MTWKPALIPASTLNPFTGQRPTRLDLETRVDTLNEVIGRPIGYTIEKDGYAYLLVINFPAGGKHVALNLGKTIPQAHKALCVAIDAYSALK